jgi:hypothetical protein
VNNKCDKCGAKLLEESAIADSWLRKTKNVGEGLPENKLHREESKQSKYTEEQKFVYQGMGIDITGKNA